MTDKEVAEGSMFTFSCPYIAGNPPETRFTWTRQKDDQKWPTQELQIEYVTRILDGTVFICEAENTMKSAFKGKSAKSFKLTVLSKWKQHVTFIQIKGSHALNVKVETNKQFVKVL